MSLAAAVTPAAERAEVFVEDTSRSAVISRGPEVQEVVSGRQVGAGVRLSLGNSSAYSHTSDLTSTGLQAAAAHAADALRWSRPVAGEPMSVPVPPPPSTLRRHQGSDSDAEVSLSCEVDQAARAISPLVRSVKTVARREIRRTLVADSLGTLSEQVVHRRRVAVTVSVSGRSGARVSARSSGGYSGNPADVQMSVAELASDAVRHALVKLESVPGPHGAMPVVLAAGSGAVMLHEAFGHGLEADHFVKQSGVFHELVGQQLANTAVTIVDDASWPGGWGSFETDDEGQPAKATTLIRAGVLEEYLWDSSSARRHRGVTSSNARRQSFQCLPLPRMSNTFLLPGDDAPADIIADTPRGLYVTRFGAGSVVTATGEFLFAINEAYRIEGGKLTRPVRGCTVSGNALAVLRGIDRVGSDFRMGPPAMCGKDGQSVPVGYGQPTIRVQHGLIVGSSSS
jgi:TldD protein